MPKKIGFLLGVGAGYVLGARAGRERYEQIASKVRGVMRDPRVQKKASQAQHLAQEKAGQAGQVAKEKAGGAGSAVTDKVKEKVQERKQESSDSADPTATTPAPSPADAGGSGSGGSGSGGSGSGGSGGSPTPHDMPSGPPADSPSAKLPPHPVAEPGNPGGSIS